MQPKNLSRYYPLFEFAARLYLAYFLADYGIVKLTGGMFNNASPQILNTPLRDVDVFHLTWYFFQKSVLLSSFVGICQIVAALLLVVRRTVLLGCLLALPILINILLVDISVGSPALTGRVGFYILLTAFFCYYRRDTVKAAFVVLTQGGLPGPEVKLWLKVLWVPVFFVVLVAVELVCSQLARYISLLSISLLRK